MRLAFLTALGVLAMPAFAQACNCIEPNMEYSDNVYQNATIVVEAEVISGGATTWMKDRELGEQVATVRPVRFYKGATEVDQILFSYSENTASCGIGTLKEGESRVFILNQQNDRLVSAGQCSMILPAYLDKLHEDAPPLVMQPIETKVETTKAEDIKALPEPVAADDAPTPLEVPAEDAPSDSE